jgi:hypothetical protein
MHRWSLIYISGSQGVSSDKLMDGWMDRWMDRSRDGYNMKK